MFSSSPVAPPPAPAASTANLSATTLPSNTGHFTPSNENSIAIHELAFRAEVDKLNQGKRGNQKLMDLQQYNRIVSILKRLNTGVTTVNALRKEGIHSAHHWQRRYSLLELPSDTSPDPDVVLIEKNIDAPLDQCRKICTLESLFTVLHHEHRHDHVKGDTLYKRLQAKWANIPRIYCQLFTKTCPICLEKGQTMKKPLSGSQPILTPGFAKRGQFDLVDMQSCPDLGFSYICNYYDHGVKFGWSQAIVSQRASCVARVLIDIFTILGPPAILQPDNARNMAKIATFPNARKIELDELYVTNVIANIKHMWPEVSLVRANPRHSAGNGGVERFNGSSLVRLGHWCVENNTTHWSIGVRIVCWR